MKSNLKKIGSLVVIGLLALNARAAILLQDNFDTYADGPLTNVSSGKWILGSKSASGTTLDVVSQKVSIGQLKNEDDLSNLSVSNNAVFSTTNILYVSYSVNYQILPTGNNGDYFTHFSGPNGFKARIFGVTNGAAPGSYRIGIANGGTTPIIFPTDLSLSTDHAVVARLLVNNGTNNPAATLWIDPVNESSPSVTATDIVASAGINAYGFRQPGSTGTTTTFFLDNLLVGSSFADVVVGSANKPNVLVQPKDGVVFSGQTFVFTNLAAGDATINYAWYFNTNTLLVESSSVIGAQSNILVLTNLQVSQSGTYSCVSSNTAGTNITRYAFLSVSASPIPPTITNQPTGSTNTIGDTVTLSVGATGLPAPAYQWKFVTNSVTNIISGATSATYSFTASSTNQSGSYFVTITNSVGYLTTNSALALVKINPLSQVSIATLHAQIDPTTFAPSNTTTLYKVRGIVTTWSDLTSVASTLFYIQDGTGGIPVFWSGANGTTNLPPPGALVEAVGPLSSFSGLLEISPVFTNALHSVTIISTNTPASIPLAQPLVFDPLLLADTATMKKLEGSYFVASNVFLASGGSFAGNVNEGITNIVTQTKSFTNSILNLTYTNGAGQSFTFFINASTDIPGQVRPTVPVTIYGILGYHTPEGFEFTPSRFADIISYVHVTNVLANARKGDLATNSYTESVVRPGESLTAYVSIGDAAGGTVTLTPTGPVPTGGSWSDVTSGSTATAIFHYTGNALDAGNNFLIQLDVTSTAGSAYTESFNVYVPTPQEQQIAITEFLVSPTTNPAASFYNPLGRASAVNGISTNDQYIEIVNESDTDLATKFTLDTGTASTPVFSSFDGFGTSLLSSNSLVVYGGNGSPSVPPPGPSTSVFPSRGLFLKTSGVLVLRNSSGNIIDRVTYSAGDVSTNGSTSRFPTWTSAFAPQTYISTNLVTPGLQYDGGSWTAPFKIPTGVTGVGITYTNGQAVLTFMANTSQASTLWDASKVDGPYNVIFGKPFPTGVGIFTNVNSATQQFYFITTQ